MSKIRSGMNSRRFVLGTANLGAAYGISNSALFNPSNSLHIIKHALVKGINTFDTASEYGLAEELLGSTLEGLPNTRVITKIPKQENYTYEYVESCLKNSLLRIKKPSIFGIMFHDPEIYKKHNVGEISKKLLDSGKIQKIGFSTYSLGALLFAKEFFPHWTLFQVPENILDRRLIESAELDELANSGNTIFVRSIFLQGLLLMKENETPKQFHQHRNLFSELHNLAKQRNATVLDLCLSYASRISWSAGSVVGAALVSQLDEILNHKDLEFNWAGLGKLPESVLDPRLWKGIK
jgi:hypothetical protein